MLSLSGFGSPVHKREREAPAGHPRRARDSGCAAPVHTEQGWVRAKDAVGRHRSPVIVIRPVDSCWCAGRWGRLRIGNGRPGQLAPSGSEFGERHCQCPLDSNRDEREVEELVRIGAHQAGGIADAGVAALIGRERKQIAKELLNAKRGAKLDRVGAIDLGCERVPDPGRIRTSSPAPTWIRSRPRRTSSIPVSTMNLSSWRRWMCSGPAFAPLAASTCARRTSSEELSSRRIRILRPSITSSPLTRGRP
jgi:hypothetical protein